MSGPVCRGAVEQVVSPNRVLFDANEPISEDARRAAAVVAEQRYENALLLLVPECVRAGKRALVGKRVKLFCEDGVWSGTVRSYSEKRKHSVMLDVADGEDARVGWYVGELEWRTYGENADWVLE